MKWFNNPHTIEELKRQYKTLALGYHPDKGGDVEVMKAINNEYTNLFERLKNIHANANGDIYESETPTTETPDEFKDIISKLIVLDGVKIEICGSWLWITGTTFKHKAVLKALKFCWSKSKRAWYYHSDPYSKRGRKTFTLDEIRGLYGSEIVTGKPQLKLSII